MIRYQKMRKELKKGIFEHLRGSLFEILKIDGEDVIMFKQLRISRRKTSSGTIYHIRDTSDPCYPELDNIYLLDILYKSLINEDKPK